MAQDEFDPKLGRIKDARRTRALRHVALVFRQAGKHGSRAVRQRGHISPATPKRGMGAGVLADLTPFIRDLMAQMERDLDTKLDWMAVDHFNTGHPHTHIVIRGRDDKGKDLVMARDYIGHGVRARAQSLITLELGPESEVER